MNFSAYKQKSLFITVALSFLVFSGSFGADLLDSVKSKTKLANDLKDVYRAYYINHKITDQKELINLYMDEGSTEELNTLLNTYIKTCDTLKQIHFFSSILNSHVSKYLVLTIQNYKIARAKGFKSTAFKTDYKKYEKETGLYMDYLVGTYPTSYFVNMTEKKYWSTVDKKNYIKSKDFALYQKLKKVDVKAALKLLDSITQKTTNFQEFVIYKVENADQYVKHDTIFNDGMEQAIKNYNAILNEKKYCIYLFEAWVKWRAVVQFTNGASKSSEIPNDKYNMKREQVALTILNYITIHPKDEMAINEFLLMATHDIVRRFGDYPYGNQSTIEYHDLFDDK